MLKPDIFTCVSLSLGFEFGSGSKPKTKTQRDQDSEFNSINFGVEIKKCLKFLHMYDPFLFTIFLLSFRVYDALGMTIFNGNSSESKHGRAESGQ